MTTIDRMLTHIDVQPPASGSSPATSTPSPSLPTSGPDADALYAALRPVVLRIVQDELGALLRFRGF